jgi:hypothetical protein
MEDEVAEGSRRYSVIRTQWMEEEGMKREY